MTPEQEAQDRLRRAIVDDEFPDAEQVEQSPFAAVIPDPLAFERNAAISAWMSQASGRNVDAGTPTWQAEKDSLAQGFFKMPTAKGITDSEIHGLVRQHVMTSEEAVMDGINAALAGRPLLETVSAFDTKAGASKLRAKWPEYSQEMRKYYDATEARVAPYRDLIKSSAAQLGSEMESGLPTTDAFKAVADQLLEIPEADRRIVIKAMAATGGDTPDAQRSYLGKLGAAFGRMSEGMGASVESGVSDLIYSMAASGGIEDVNPEAASALRQQGQTTRSYYQLANMVRKVADSDISPIEAEGFLAETGIGLARMGPLLASSAVPYAGVATMASFYRDDVAANLMLEYEGLDAAKADKIALVAAPGIAALEHASNLLPFGKIPGVGSFLKSSITSIKAGIIRGGTLVAAGTGGEIAEEVFQEIAPKLVQDLFAEVDKEVPGVNWTDEKKKLEKIPAQVFGPALAVSLIGGGVVSVNDVKHGRAISSDRDTLIASGYAPSMADEIALKSKEGDWPAVDALMRSAYDRKKGGISGATEQERKAAVEAIQAKVLLQQSAIESLRNNGDLARAAKIGGQWVVTRPDGSAPVAFDNPDDANDLVFQDAKERNLRVQAVYRDIISQANRDLQEGQELAFVFSPEKMDAKYAVQIGLVSAEAVEGRKKQLAALDEGKLEDQDFTRAEKEAQAEGDTDAVYTILGMNNIENREGVSRGVIRLFQGANFTDLIEEISEVSLKRHLISGEAKRPSMLASLRQAESAIQSAEQAAGLEPTLLFRTKDDAQISDGDLIEAFSHLAKSYYINAIEDGKTSQNWRLKNRNVTRHLRALRSALANTEIFKWLKAMGEKLGTIYKRAAMVQEAQKAGGLDAGLEQLIRRSVGLDMQDQMEAGILQEAQGMVEEAGMSLSKVTPAQDAEYLAAVESGNLEKAQKMVDDAAKAAGYRVGPVWHGTLTDFTTFELDDTRARDSGFLGRAFYFTRSEGMAESFGPRVVAAFLKADNPFDVRTATIDEVISLVQASRKIKGLPPLDEGKIDGIRQDWQTLVTRDNWIQFDGPTPIQREVFIKSLGDTSAMAKAAGYDSVIGASEQAVAVFEPSQIKSADPVTRDASGNIIPLSQRFNEESNNINFSLSKGDQSLEQRLAAMFDPFQKNPEQRRKLGLIAKERVAKVAAEYADVVAMAGATREKLAALDTKYSEELAASRADFQAEMKALRDERDFELEGAKQQKETKVNIEKIKADYARRIAARDKAWEREKGDLELRQSNERGAIQRGLGKLDTESLRQAIRTLRAAVSIMPADVVKKVFPDGVQELTNIKTDAGRLAAIERIVVEADVELEKFLRKDIGQKLDKQLAAAAVKGKGGEIPKSKFIVTVQDELDEIIRIAAQTADNTSVEIIQTEALLTAAPDDESAADATAKLALLEIFGDVFGKTSSAEQMANASDYLTKLMKEGREARKMLDKDRQQALKAQIEQAKADAFKGKAGADTVQAGKDKGKGTVKGTFNKFARELFSHKAVLSSLFGVSEKTANTFDERLILNTNAFEDTQNDRRKRMRDFMRALYGTKQTIKLNRAINALEIKKKNTGITMTKGRVTKRDEQDVEAVAEILKNPANFGYSAKEAKAWQEEIDAWAILPENRKRKLFIEREIEKGDRVELELSQMEAVYITMALRQPGILEQQEMHGFDQTTLDQAEKFLSKDSKAWRAYMQAEYDAEYEVANTVFMRMFNTRLPRIRFYAPLLKNHQGAQAALDPLNTGVTKQSVNPGSIKSRNARSSSLRIESALAVYQSHFVQMDYWVHMAEYLRDVQGVMLNSEVRDAIVSAHGEESMNALSAWIEIEMSRGVTKSALAIQGSKMMRNIKQGINFKALAFNIGTAIKSTDSAVRSLSEIPLQRWPVAMKNGFKYWSKLRKSNILQNRFELGGTVEMREINANAGRSKWWAVDGLEILLKNGTFATKYWDLWMTSFSAAMAYGDSYQQALDANPDISEQQADAYARRQTEIIVTRTSMPVNAFGKSLIEADTKGLAAMVMIFVSDPRQKAGLVGEAIMNWRRGGIGNEEVVRRILANWIIPGIIFQTMHAVVRSMFKNDDEEWTVEEFITAAMVGPLQGVAILGSGVESFVSYAVATAAELITGEESKRKNPFLNGSNPIQEASLELVRSMDKLPEKIEQGEMMSGAWDIIKAGGLITTPFNPAGAAPSTLDRVAKDTTTLFYELTGEND